jgi:hypothetical protein
MLATKYILLVPAALLSISVSAHAACMANGQGCNARQQQVIQNTQQFQNQMGQLQQNIDGNFDNLRQNLQQQQDDNDNDNNNNN